MIRIRCTRKTANGQCKNQFRTRKNHDLCRSCHREIYHESRPIESRFVVTHGYRRTRSRRGITSRTVPKVIQNRNKQRGNNANG